MAELADDWPHTRRWLPWLVASLLVMVYWVPFESINLPISLPINSELDRFVVGFVFGVWVLIAVAAPRFVTFRSAPTNQALYLFIAVAVVSIAVNFRQLAWDGDLTLAIKQLSLIMSYTAVYLVVATSIRRSEVEPFAKLLVALAIGTAIGTIYQYVTGSNPFFAIARVIFVGTRVESLTTEAIQLGGPGARPSITGPTAHGLADATLISTAVPFCVCFASIAARRAKVGWWVGIIVLLAGCFATGRKTALIVPAISFAVLVLYQPRAYARYLFAPLLAIGALLAIAPNALNILVDQIVHASQSSSTVSRTVDYGAVFPDISSHLLLGRGYGSFDPLKYRILDDQMLGWLVQVGVIGAVAYAGMVLSAVATVHAVASRAQTGADRMMQAVAAASVGYFVSNFFYDTFGFREAPYTFFFVAALGVVFAGDRMSPVRSDMSHPLEPATT